MTCVEYFFNFWGFVPEERLSQASGALSDIQVLVTSCVPRTADTLTHEIAEAVLLRILSSADCQRQAPSWYVHEWEQKAWERYLSGDIKACATYEL